jgi:hypothetical protein
MKNMICVSHASHLHLDGSRARFGATHAAAGMREATNGNPTAIWYSTKPTTHQRPAGEPPRLDT